MYLRNENGQVSKCSEIRIFTLSFDTTIFKTSYQKFCFVKNLTTLKLKQVNFCLIYTVVIATQQ